MNYAICQIGSRQYLVKPGQIIEVDKLADEQKSFALDKVMLMVNGDKIELGQPYLNETLDFEVVDSVKKPKIRVAKYKSKANYRRVSGQRQEVSRIRLVEKLPIKDKKTTTVKKT